MASFLAGLFGRAGLGRAALGRAALGRAVTRLGSTFARSRWLRSAGVSAARTPAAVRYSVNGIRIPNQLNKNLIKVRLATGEIAPRGSWFPKNWVKANTNSNYANNARMRGLSSANEWALSKPSRIKTTTIPSGPRPAYSRPLRFEESQVYNSKVPKYFETHPFNIRPRDIRPDLPPPAAGSSFYSRLRGMLREFRRTPGAESGPAGRRISESLQRGPIKNLNLPDNIQKVPSNVRSYLRSLYTRLRAWYRNRAPTEVWRPKLNKELNRGWYPGVRTGPSTNVGENVELRDFGRSRVKRKAPLRGINYYPNTINIAREGTLSENAGVNVSLPKKYPYSGTPQRIREKWEAEAPMTVSKKSTNPFTEPTKTGVKKKNRAPAPPVGSSPFDIEMNNVKAKAPKPPAKKSSTNPFSFGKKNKAPEPPAGSNPFDVEVKKSSKRQAPKPPASKPSTSTSAVDSKPVKPKRTLGEKIVNKVRKVNQKAKVKAVELKYKVRPTRTSVLRQERIARNTGRDLLNAALYPGVSSKKDK